MRDPVPYAIALWALSALFLLRVLGQVAVAAARPRWLPRMEQWYSGLLAYRYLLPVQILILGIMVAVASDFWTGHGVFVDPRRPLPGRWLVGYSYVYMLAMLVRYGVWMKRRPDQRWLGGTIPIAFHLVLALFLYVVGRYHAP